MTPRVSIPMIHADTLQRKYCDGTINLYCRL